VRHRIGRGHLLHGLPRNLRIGPLIDCRKPDLDGVGDRSHASNAFGRRFGFCFIDIALDEARDVTTPSFTVTAILVVSRSGFHLSSSSTSFWISASVLITCYL
jgi:hypothetical protein